MIIHNLILLILLITLSECHKYQQQNQPDNQQHQHQHQHQGRRGHNIKSYGGYFHDHNGYGDASNNFAHSQNYHNPQSSYQPYGWNFNQPSRTYGGVNYLSHQPANNNNNNQNRQPTNNNIGWANTNGYAGLNPSPFFPTFPNFYPNTFQQNPFASMFPHNYNYPSSGQTNPSGGQIYNYFPSQGSNPTGSNTPGQLPYPTTNQGMPMPNQPYHPQNNYNQGVPTGSGNKTPGQNSFNQGVPTGSGNTTPGHNSFNQGVPTGSGNTTPGHNSFNQGVPTGSGNRTPGQNSFNQGVPGANNNLQPSQGQFPANNNGLNTGETDFQTPLNPNFEKPNEADAAFGIDIRAGSDSNNKNSAFPSHSLFGINDNRQWSEEDESNWQATTKAPYFENKVPGLNCKLPASAVLGVQSAFKASNLLPLNVPAGNPILSCNATDLLQSQINLGGKVYDCHESEITVSCPTHDGRPDQCEGSILRCDTVNNRVNQIWCTNGTIISNSDIICSSASLLPSKSILNCLLKQSFSPNNRVETTTSSTSLINVLPVVPLPNFNNNNDKGSDDYGNEQINFGGNENVFIDFDSSEQAIVEEKELIPQVKNAMKNVFPHELLTKPSTKYLPPKQSRYPINPDLRNQINGVFKVDLLALSKNHDDLDQNRPNDFANARSIECNRNQGNGCNRNQGIKTGSRFGGGIQQDLHERLIVTD